MKYTKLENIAPLIAMLVAFILTIIKFIVGLLSGSISLLSSALDSLLDTGVSIFNYFAIKYASEEADNEHNYGHGKMEAVAATFEGVIITLSGLYIVYESVMKIINPETINYLNWSLVVMGISILATGGLVYFLNYVYKKTDNLVIKGDVIHYKLDLYINISVMIVLIVIFFFPTLSWVDGVVGLIIGLYIIYEAWELIQDGLKFLLDRTLEEHDKVKEIIDGYLLEGKFDSYHCLKTRAGGSKDKFVEFHFVMHPDTTILKAHNVGDKIEEDIKKIDTNANWHIIWHADPHDDSVQNGCK